MKQLVGQLTKGVTWISNTSYTACPIKVNIAGYFFQSKRPTKLGKWAPFYTQINSMSWYEIPLDRHS